MSFTTYTSKNLIKTVQNTSFYDYLTGSVVDEYNQVINSLNKSAKKAAENGVKDWKEHGYDEDYTSSYTTQAVGLYRAKRDLEAQNAEMSSFAISQFSDDFVESPRLQLEIPNYSVENYIEERAKWTKGITSVADEPGWFYFKIFFKFNTNYGLFGGVLRDTNAAAYFPSNCALKYLWAIDKYYTSDNVEDRIVALYKFTDMLSDICTNSPWLFKGVNGLGDAMKIRQNDFSKDQKIEILFNDERTDMRIGSLLNLYKFLCYDDINCKEVLPENLRKFDMCISLFHVPIKYFQTGIMVSNKKNLATGLFSGKLAKIESIIEKTVNFLTTKAKYFKYKTMYPENGNFSNMFSFKLFTFSNCEIDIDSISKYLESSQIDNSTAFNLGKGMSLAIKYDRVYYSEMNEWNQFMFGSMGFEYNAYNEEFKERFIKFPDDFGLRRVQPKNYWLDRLTSLKEAKEDSNFYDKNAEQYKALIDYSESIITDGLMSMDMEDYYSFIKGNIYGGSALINSPYWRSKMGALKYGSVKGNIYGEDLSPQVFKNACGQIGIEERGYFYEKLNQLKTGSVKGNLYGEDLSPKIWEGANGQIGLDDGYFKEKIKELKNGSVKGNLYGENLSPQFFKNSSGQIGLEERGYFYEKIKELKNGSVKGNLYGEDLSPKVWESVSGEIGLDNGYFKEKIQQLKNGSIQGNLYGKELLDYQYVYDDASNETVMINGYFKEKINRLKGPNNIGNLYDKELGPNIIKNGSGQIGLEGGYFYEKLKLLKKGKISGNLYDRIYGVVVHEAEGVTQENSEYLNEKLRALKGNSASGGRPAKSSLGNLFGDEISMIGNFDDRAKSEYLSKKVNMIKNGTIAKASLYGDLTLTGPIDDRQKTQFYKEKLDHLMKSKNLGNIYSLEQSGDLSTFISKSSEARKPILNDSEYIESLEGDLELRNALNLSDTGMVGPQPRKIEISEDLAPESQFDENRNNGYEIRNNLASLYYASPDIDRNYTSENEFKLDKIKNAADDSFKSDDSASKLNTLKKEHAHGSLDIGDNSKLETLKKEHAQGSLNIAGNSTLDTLKKQYAHGSLNTAGNSKLDTLKKQYAHETLEVNQVAKVKREIWNYQLTGDSKGSLGGVLDTIGDIASFWQFD